MFRKYIEYQRARFALVLVTLILGAPMVTTAAQAMV